MTAKQYLLDTNVLLAYIRAGKVGEYVERTYKLQSLPFQPLICVVSVGEIRAIAAGRSWRAAKLRRMEAILQRIVIVDISETAVIDAYVRVVISRPKGVTLPQNDMWIAAATMASGACLLTCDTHFDFLADNGSLKREWIDPRVGERTPGGGGAAAASREPPSPE